MNRYKFYIIACTVCIILPIVGVLYGIWNSHQPKVGPVGDGHTSLKFYQIIPFISTFLLGVINLPVAIIRYHKHKQSTNVGNQTEKR
jgi:uncharacterized membrane protein